MPIHKRNKSGRCLDDRMAGKGRKLHPYDLLASPRRRNIVKALENGPLTYSEIMEVTGIDDSGKLSYHLGVLSHYIHHEENLYSLSFEGKILSRAATEFEKKAYGLMTDVLLSGEVDPTGYVRSEITIGLSITVPTGEVHRWDETVIDREKIREATRSRLEDQHRQSELGEVYVGFEQNRMIISYELGTQAYVRKGEWFVGNIAAKIRPTEKDDSQPIPGIHARSAGAVLYPEAAEIEHLYPERETLEEAGLEIYEFAQDGQNVTWRVRGDDILYLGEIRMEGSERPREVFESELHVSPKEPPERWGEARRNLLDVPKLIGGKTRFRVKTIQTGGDRF